MKKQIVSTLLALCMLLCLMPTAAFAEESTETPPVCSCETACTAESMNTDCPVCGAEGALPENCAKCAQPADAAAAQPEGEVSDPQPETALTALIGAGEMPATSGAVTEVSTADELTAAIAGVNFDTVKLAGNISISSTLIVNRPDVTLDLNGYTLTCGDTECDNIFSVDEHGNLTVKDSGTGGKIDGQNNNCGFSINGGILTLKSGTIINCTTNGDGGAVDISDGGKFEMSGGAITNCKTNDDSGAVDIGDGCTFIMNSGTISGCSVDDDAGAIFIKGNATFLMNGGTIENCSAGNNGGAVKMRSTSRFTMNGGTISSCTAQQGGGVYVDGSSTFTMNGGSIAKCTAVNGGNSVFVVNPSASFTMTDGTVDGSIALPYKVGNDTVYMDGLGTAAYPYQISTADQLKLFRDIVNGENGRTRKSDACATLTADIVLNDGTFDEDGNYTPGPSGAALTEWSPMGVSNSTVYAGTFDGAGHTIQGLYCNSNSQAPGLFGYIAGATIQDVRVTGHFNADRAEHAGCIVAFAQNSRITGCVSTASINGHHSFQSATGGIVGIAESSTQVSDCINYGTVKCITSESDAADAGGIVGWLADSSNITNCSNFGTVIGLIYGSNTSPIYVGGIVGFAWTKSISDCYNAGAVRINEQGNSSATHGAGGIAGFAGFDDTHPVKISNCYNVGSVTAANANAMLGGIVGWSGYDSVAITNCYYLTGTAGQVYGNGTATVTATTEKSTFDFANGTVRRLLKAGERTGADPWADECKYLDAAGKTLPVFNGQGDAHDHQSSDWESNETEHWQVCTCGVVFNKAAHSGGTATCTEKAKCAVCGAEYGDVLGHDFTTSWTHDDNEHWKQCSRCDEKDNAGPHTWDNGTITTAPTCTKAGEETYSCTKCGATKIETIPATGHSWKSEWTSDATHHWYECDNKNCDVTDNAGKDGYAEHSGGKATCTEKAKCTVCGVKYGAIDSANHTGKEQWTQTATTHEKKWNCCNTVSVPNENHEWTDGVCSECGYVCQHEDADKNHICDICGKTISEHKDADNNHICDYCNKKISDHSGSKATCKAQAVCEICKEGYGSLDPNNHTDLKHIDAKAATAAEEGNIEYWYCGGCNKYFSDAAAKTEITEAATVTAKLPPKITAGDGAAVTQGEKKELTFTSDASFADFLRVELDGTTLEEKNYTKREGSTIITLNRDFVATLSVGEHTLAIVSKSGTATAKFTVKAKPAETATPQPTVTLQPTVQPQPTAQPQPTVQPVSPIPSTGDTANPALWFALLIVSGFALAAIFVLRRKGNRK